ncbi:MAG: hypothetical protein Q8Q08_09995 [Candidatus Omnitrophota bacterium]|nr:hypothetical protein [Candidatus Omnitrophota bacterium]
MVIRMALVVMVCFGLMGCSVKRIGYTTVGTAAGAGIGYSYHKDPQEAAIGGVAGGASGAIVATVQENTENKKYKAGYEKGYNQAQVDIAVQNWNDNTGKCALKRNGEYKHLSTFKVPEREQDNVIYESHYVTLEDYR